MKNTIYTLPQDSFVAGQTREYAWRLFSESKEPFDAKNCSLFPFILTLRRFFGGNEGITLKTFAVQASWRRDIIRFSFVYLYRYRDLSTFGRQRIHGCRFFCYFILLLRYKRQQRYDLCFRIIPSTFLTFRRFPRTVFRLRHCYRFIR